MKNQVTILIMAIAMLHLAVWAKAQSNPHALLLHISPEKVGQAEQATNPVLQQILSTFQATYSIPFPGAESAYLKRARKAVPNNVESTMALKQALEQTLIFESIDVLYDAPLPKIFAVAECNNPEPITDPESANQTYLDLMEFPCAWTITQGSQDISVGICDISLNMNHPDLAGKVLDVECIGCNPNHANICDHGFSTAGAVAALHNTMCIAGAGKNSTVKGYLWGSPDCGHLSPDLDVVWAAYNAGNRVILAETGRFWESSQTLIDAFTEMTNGGAVIVLPSLITSSTGTGHSAYGNIDGVIVVGPLDDQFNTFSYTHPNIDMEIGVPGRHVSNAEDIYQLDSPDDGDGLLCRPNVGGGTSIGSPHVAATVSLMLAVNSCLSPSEIESILKATAKPANALNGAGSLNAYQAVLAAQNAATACCAPEQDRHITENTTFDTPTEFNGNVYVHTGAQLTITSTIQFAKDKGIIVERGAKLHVNGGTLTRCPNAEDWRGINVEGNASLPQPDAFSMPAANEAGVVLINNLAHVEWARTAISTTRYNEGWNSAYWGGMVHCEDATFSTNGRVAEFMKYDLPNQSKFINCTMESGGVGYAGVTIWDTDNVTFNRCRFYNMSSQGILTYDAGAVVKDGNDFHHNWRGISSRATYPYSAFLEVGDLSSDPNYFLDNWFHIESNASKYGPGLSIINNEFFESNTAIWLIGPSRFTIGYNSFDQTTGGVYASQTGAMGWNQHNYVRNNAISASSGITASGLNREMQFLCNDFAASGIFN